MQNRFREAVGLIRYNRKWTERFAEHDVRNAFRVALADLERVGLGDLRNLRVLDVGCGPRYGFALQCAAQGAVVTALDTEDVRPGLLPVAAWRALVHNGARAALKCLIRRVFFDRAYFEALERVSGRRLADLARDVRFVVADEAGAEYPLPSEAFDLVAAIAVIEHLVDVRAFAKEIRRILVPGGLFYAIIHNYFSLSGGHEPEWAYPDESSSQRVPPWDHLRERRFVPSVHLNGLRPEEYRAALREELDVLVFEGRGIDHRPGGPEGERFLTGETAGELRAYPRELLLTRSWCVICRRDRAS